jgi:hypothetical protein
MLVLELSHMTAYCGYITRREPLGCFHGTEPNTGKKPDLIISNPRMLCWLAEVFWKMVRL